MANENDTNENMTNENDISMKIGKIESCTIFTNGMVASYDKEGNQIPDCQGFILDIAEKLKTYCDENTIWHLGKYGEWMESANMNWYWKKTENNEQMENDDQVQI